MWRSRHVDTYEVLSNRGQKSTAIFDLFDIPEPPLECTFIFATRKAKIPAAPRCLFFLHYATMVSLDRSRIGA